MVSRRYGASVNPVEVAARVDRLTDSDVYNWKASNTRKLQRSLATVARGSASDYAEHVFIGGGSVYQKNVTTWPSLLRTRMDALGYPSAGTGWVWSNDGYNDHDTRISKTGAWTLASGYTHTTTSGATLTFHDTAQAGTMISVAYLDNSEPFTVSVYDDTDTIIGSPVTVTPGATATAQVYTRTVAGDTTHKVVVATTSTNPTYIVGFRVGKTTGFRVNRLGGFGWAASGWYTPTSTFSVPNLINWIIPSIDVVHAAFGLGDVYTGRTVSQFTADLAAIRARFPSADFILYSDMEHQQHSTAAHVAAMYDVADTLDCPLVDIRQRAGGSYASANAAGLVSGQYPTTKGHHLWAILASQLLTVPHG